MGVGGWCDVRLLALNRPVVEEHLTEDDLDVILEALIFYKIYIEGSDDYPSEQARQDQLDRLKSPIARTRLLREQAQEEYRKEAGSQNEEAVKKRGN